MGWPAKMEQIEVPEVRWLFNYGWPWNPCIANKASSKSKEGAIGGADEPLGDDQPKLLH